jgi:hypothetical protein
LKEALMLFLFFVKLTPSLRAHSHNRLSATLAED